MYRIDPPDQSCLLGKLWFAYLRIYGPLIVICGLALGKDELPLPIDSPSVAHPLLGGSY